MENSDKHRSSDRFDERVLIAIKSAGVDVARTSVCSLALEHPIGRAKMFMVIRFAPNGRPSTTVEINWQQVNSSAAIQETLDGISKFLSIINDILAIA